MTASSTRTLWLRGMLWLLIGFGIGCLVTYSTLFLHFRRLSDQMTADRLSAEVVLCLSRAESIRQGETNAAVGELESDAAAALIGLAAHYDQENSKEKYDAHSGVKIARRYFTRHAAQLQSSELNAALQQALQNVRASGPSP